MIYNKVQLKNNYVCDRLKTIEDNVLNLVDKINYKTKLEATDFISEKYCKDIIDRHVRHEGIPEKEEMLDILNSKQFRELEEYKEIYPIIFSESIKLQEFLSSTNQALFAYYPPKGFISWHNNANAPGYNVLFTSSETGDGWFAYKDDDGNTIKVQDERCWSCKMMHFASYYDKENRNPMYHAAYTKCKRITMAFRFEESQNIWNDLMEDLQSEQ